MWQVEILVIFLASHFFVSSAGNAPNFASDQQGPRRLTHASTCTRWETFGSASGGINSQTDLADNEWTTTAVVFNSEAYSPSPEWLTFYREESGEGGSVGYIEKLLPTGGDFVRVRYGSVKGSNSLSAATKLDVGTGRVRNCRYLPGIGFF